MRLRQAPMEAGDRDREIRIDQRTAVETQDTLGAPSDGTWTTLVRSMPASREDIRGIEREVDNQTAAKLETRWEINYRADMDPALVDVPTTRRIVHRGRIYDITAAEEIGRREGIAIITRAGSRVDEDE